MTKKIFSSRTLQLSTNVCCAQIVELSGFVEKLGQARAVFTGGKGGQTLPSRDVFSNPPRVSFFTFTVGLAPKIWSMHLPSTKSWILLLRTQFLLLYSVRTAEIWWSITSLLNHQITLWTLGPLIKGIKGP